MRYLLIVSLVSLAVHAADPGTEKLTVSEVWAPLIPAVTRSAAVYMKITNRATTAERLLGVSSSAARHSALHAMIMEGDIARMRPLSALEIPAGKSVLLEPGGLHVMLVGLNQPLTEGQTIPLTLRFESAGTRVVRVAVQKRSAPHTH
ncbi:MAG: copper chaperone PCu(A)C [Burkholderiales bacterium]